ncbi:DsbA family protein [Micromonospora echinofusca]|uniref:Thioredoxin domain-containing protein n=1 Tax=Micromonospora echinofusca TaxID=47858 RepID=A0ABS3VXG4_MICEH|nr:thioredoxin domain-containing protein [Micromonospora echinofusca]MBO4209227.1 thioredoxin domain-containing protein [Micromonospora echinofusca]
MSSRKGRNEAARVVREQLARERRRKRTLWTSVAAVAVLVIAGLIGWSIYSSQRSDGYTAPTGANDAGTGVVAGSGPVTVDIYEDFICPACQQFEQASGATIDQLISEGKVRVVYHPVAYLDRFSTTKYSTRSSAASGCAAEGGKYREYAKALFEKQPPEGGAGLSDDQLVDIAAGVGLDRDGFASCLREGTFKAWTEHVTEEASKAGISGTPTILVNGQQVADRSPEGLRAAVEAAGK